MFICHIDEEKDEDESFYNVEIEYISPSISFTFNPEECQIISNVDVNAVKGHIEGEILNGTFSLSWDDEKIDVCCAKYGSGEGGGLNITLRNNEDIMKSLRDALIKWKSKIASSKILPSE